MKKGTDTSWYMLQYWKSGCWWLYIPIVHSRWWSDSEGCRSCCCWSGRRHLLWFCGSKCNRPRSRRCVILHHNLPTVIHCNASLVRQLEPMWQLHDAIQTWLYGKKFQWSCTSITIIQHQMQMLAYWGVTARYFVHQWGLNHCAWHLEVQTNQYNLHDFAQTATGTCMIKY